MIIKIHSLIFVKWNAIYVLKRYSEYAPSILWVVITIIYLGCSINLISFLFYLSIPFSLFYTLISYKVIALLLAIKILIEFFLLYLGTKKLFISNFIIDFIVWQIFHIPYICIVGLLSYFPQFFRWRERKLW